MGFNLIYWTPICGTYFLDGFILEKCGQIWKRAIVRAATAGLGCKGLIHADTDNAPVDESIIQINILTLILNTWNSTTRNLKK